MTNCERSKANRSSELEDGGGALSPQYLLGAELESLVTEMGTEVARDKLPYHRGDPVTVRSAYFIAVLILTLVTALLRLACHS